MQVNTSFTALKNGNFIVGSTKTSVRLKAELAFHWKSLCM